MDIALIIFSASCGLSMLIISIGFVVAVFYYSKLFRDMIAEDKPSGYDEMKARHEEQVARVEKELKEPQ